MVGTGVGLIAALSLFAGIRFQQHTTERSPRDRLDSYRIRPVALPACSFRVSAPGRSETGGIGLGRHASPNQALRTWNRRVLLLTRRTTGREACR